MDHNRRRGKVLPVEVWRSFEEGNGCVAVFENEGCGSGGRLVMLARERDTAKEDLVRGSYQ